MVLIEDPYSSDNGLRINNNVINAILLSILIKVIFILLL
jgi:hypothetical protein